MTSSRTYDPADPPTGFRSAFVFPFAVCLVLAVGTLPLNDDPFVWQVGAALALQATLAIALWQRADIGGSRLVALSAIAIYLISIALFRAGLGETSGYGALVLLPVMWAAFTGRRLELVAALGGMGLLFAVPLAFVGEPDYPDFIWRGGALTIALATSLGFAIQALMNRLSGELRRSSAILASMSEGLALTRDGEIVSVNRALCDMTGFAEPELIGQRPPYSFWPADVREATATLRQQDISAAGGELELVLARADGSRFPASITATPIDVGDGSLAFLNTVRDVTTQREHDEAVQRNAKQLTAIAEVTRAVGHSDPLDAHRTLCRIALQVCDGAHVASIWERQPDGLLVATSVQPDPGTLFTVRPDHESHGAHVVFRTGTSLFVSDAHTSEHCDQRIIGRLGSASVHFHPVADASGVRGVLAINWPYQLERLPQDIEPLLRLLADEAALALQRADLLARLDELTRTDELTGLPNRRAWDDVILREMDHAIRRRQPLSVAMLDLDHFKVYNDENGHLVGDQLLRDAADGWRTKLRSTDVLARWGGEEFALLLPDCDTPSAIALIERLRGSLPDGMTFSAGVAPWDGSASPVELINAADHAMYAAKARGRDRIETSAQDARQPPGTSSPRGGF